MPLNSMRGLEVQSVDTDGPNPVKTKADLPTFQGRRALHVINEDGVTSKSTPTGGQTIAIIKTFDFKDGTIEGDVAGGPARGSAARYQGIFGHCFPYSRPRLAL